MYNYVYTCINTQHISYLTFLKSSSKFDALARAPSIKVWIVFK